MKKINRKYSKIVLTKRDYSQRKLEMTKASHSLDLGVRSEHSIYKPNFTRIKSIDKGKIKYELRIML
jgi:hypothetical protein